MPVLAVSNIFSPATLIQSSQANQNFDDVEAFVNTNVIQKDASIAFTAVPSGPAADPVSANQFTRKAYVDTPFGYNTIAFSLANTAANGVNSVGAVWTSVNARGLTGTTSGFTITTTRLYLVGAAVAWATSSGGLRRQFGIRQNGTIIPGLVSFGAPTAESSGFGMGNGVSSRPILLTAGDTIDACYNQNSGSPLALNGAMWIMAIPGL